MLYLFKKKKKGFHLFDFTSLKQSGGKWGSRGGERERAIISVILAKNGHFSKNEVGKRRRRKRKSHFKCYFS